MCNQPVLLCAVHCSVKGSFENATTLGCSVGHDSFWLTKLMFVLRYPLTPSSYTLTLSVVGQLTANCGVYDHASSLICFPSLSSESGCKKTFRFQVAIKMIVPDHVCCVLVL